MRTSRLRIKRPTPLPGGAIGPDIELFIISMGWVCTFYLLSPSIESHCFLVLISHIPNHVMEICQQNSILFLNKTTMQTFQWWIECISTQSLIDVRQSTLIKLMGSHGSIESDRKFPFPLHFMLIFPWLHDSHLSVKEKPEYLQTLGLTEIRLEIRDNTVLGLLANRSCWLSRRTFFPDFPWWWELRKICPWSRNMPHT